MLITQNYSFVKILPTNLWDVYPKSCKLNSDHLVIHYKYLCQRGTSQLVLKAAALKQLISKFTASWRASSHKNKLWEVLLDSDPPDWWFIQVQMFQTFSTLNSAEPKICPANRNYLTFFFSTDPVNNNKIPIIVSKINFMLNGAEHDRCFITLGTDQQLNCWLYCIYSKGVLCHKLLKKADQSNLCKVHRPKYAFNLPVTT